MTARTALASRISHRLNQYRPLGRLAAKLRAFAPGAGETPGPTVRKGAKRKPAGSGIADLLRTPARSNGDRSTEHAYADARHLTLEAVLDDIYEEGIADKILTALDDAGARVITLHTNPYVGDR